MEPKEGLSEPLPQPERLNDDKEKGAEAPSGVEGTPSRQKRPVLPQAPQDIPSANPVQLPSASDDDKPDSRKAVVKSASEARIAERQWVQRAKQIVEQTKDDPYKQNHEVSKAKAEYIKERFNKTVRTDAGAA